MFRKSSLCLAFGVLVAFGAAAEEASSEDVVYVKMDYMQLVDSTPQEYFALELGEWRPIHARRIDNGVILAWYFYEMMPGVRRDGDQPYDYVTVSVFDSYEKVVGDAGTRAIFDVYPGIDLEVMYDRADEARAFVRSDLWRIEATAAEALFGKPVAPYLLFRFLKEDGEGAEDRKEARESLMERGILRNAARLRLANPEDEERPYGLGVIEYYDGLRDLLAPLDKTVAAARLDLSDAAAAAFVAEHQEPESLYKSQVWRLVDAIEGATPDRN